MLRSHWLLNITDTFMWRGEDSLAVDTDLDTDTDLQLYHAQNSQRKILLKTYKQNLAVFISGAVSPAYEGPVSSDLPQHT